MLFGFSTTVTFDIVTRSIGHPWLWLQEVTSTFFIYAIFIGAAVATRRNDRLGEIEDETVEQTMKGERAEPLRQSRRTLHVEEQEHSRFRAGA